MKKLVFILGASILTSLSYSQKTNNVFLNYEEFYSSEPSNYCEFTLKHRTNGNVFMTGGITNHRIKKTKPETVMDWMIKSVWGVQVDDSIYINSFPYSGIIGYNKVLEKGYYSYFIGEPARKQEYQVKVGIIEEGESQISVCCKTGYVILPNGTIKWLQPNLLKELVSDQPKLLEEVESKKFKPEDTLEMFEILNSYNSMKKE